MTPHIPSKIVDEIREHQKQAIRPSREIVGRIVVRKGKAVRYERLRNWAHGDGKFAIRSRDLAYGLKTGEDAIMVHSHPSPWHLDCPSRDDLRGANKYMLERPYAIYHGKCDTLRIYKLHSCRTNFSVLGEVQ